MKWKRIERRRKKRRMKRKRMRLKEDKRVRGGVRG